MIYNIPQNTYNVINIIIFRKKCVVPNAPKSTKNNRTSFHLRKPNGYHSPTIFPHSSSNTRIQGGCGVISGSAETSSTSGTFPKGASSTSDVDRASTVKLSLGAFRPQDVQNISSRASCVPHPPQNLVVITTCYVERQNHVELCVKRCISGGNGNKSGSRGLGIDCKR